MRSQILVKRYTQGLVNALKDEEEFRAVSLELAEFAGLLQSHKELQGVLLNPFVARGKKVRIISDILSRRSLNEKTARFFQLLLEKNRIELMDDIVGLMPEVWNEKKGIVTMEVSSVVPLTKTQQRKLQRELERLEKKPVFLKYRLDPELLGGLSVKKGNMVYDISLKGSLVKLKEIISERS